MADRSLTAPVIGIIGGVGSGKSFLARALAEKHPIAVLDGDAAGHRVLAEPDVQKQIQQRFGNGVLHKDGTVNRRAVGQLVFGTEPAHQQARVELESIVHPRIRDYLKQDLETARRNPAVKAVLLDAAVLLEAGWRPLCDAVVFVDTTFEQRLERVTRTRGWSRDQLASREASQLSLEAKRKEADYVVDNSQGPEKALSQLEQILQQVCTTP